MKKTLVIMSVLFFGITSIASANTQGYAWSESVGWFDFSNVVITDTNVTGHAYNDNTGFLSFADGTSVTNSNGTLSGYAWSESVGWFDFSNVTISNGTLTGYAYNDNTGFLSFADGTSVTTTWTIPSASVTAEEESRKKKGGRVTPPPQLQPGYIPPSTTPSITTITTIINQYRTLLTQLIAMGIDLPQNVKDILNQTPPSNTTTFTKDLELGENDPEVKLLQQFLNSKGYTLAETGPGSKGNETTIFGYATRAALIKFQQDNNISPAIGYFGPVTRSFINNNH